MSSSREATRLETGLVSIPTAGMGRSAMNPDQLVLLGVARQGRYAHAPVDPGSSDERTPERSAPAIR